MKGAVVRYSSDLVDLFRPFWEKEMGARRHPSPPQTALFIGAIYADSGCCRPARAWVGQ